MDVKPTNLVSIKAQDSATFTIQGYGVVFGGRDLAGNHFSDKTDFWLNATSPNPPVLYNHWMFDEDTKGVVMGRVTDRTKDALGLWYEAQLEQASEYAAMIKELIEEGVLGFSTGSAPHVVQYVGNAVKTWPIFELSLTPTPMEPRTIGVELKSFAISLPSFVEDRFGSRVYNSDRLSKIANIAPAEPTGDTAGSTGDYEKAAVLASIAGLKSQLNID